MKTVPDAISGNRGNQLIFANFVLFVKNVTEMNKKLLSDNGSELQGPIYTVRLGRMREAYDKPST